VEETAAINLQWLIALCGIILVVAQCGLAMETGK